MRISIATHNCLGTSGLTRRRVVDALGLRQLMGLRIGDEPMQLRHARTTIGAGPQPIPDRG
jgi:hypothetical protein